MKNKKDSKKNKNKHIDLIIEIVLVCIIAILFLHNCELMKKGNTQEVNGGNINVIEIKCNSNNTCEPVKPSEPSNNGGKGNKGNNSSGNNNGNTAIDEPSVEGETDLSVFDKEIEWDGITEAKIFTNSIYELDGVIAPGSSNTYQFVVKNGNNYRIKYDISFIEDNPYNANMRYKLKKNDTYLIDEYVSASELVSQNNMLEANSNDTFYLDWKWVSSSNDTDIGEIGNATYGLKIEVEAESVNG